MKKIILATLATLAVVAVAVVGSVAPAAAAGLNVGGIVDAILPSVQVILSAAASAAATWIAYLIHQKLRISIDESSNAILQTAVQNGAGWLIARVQSATQGKTIDIKSPYVAEAANIVLMGLPEVAKRFGLDANVIAQKILAKVPQIDAEAKVEGLPDQAQPVAAVTAATPAPAPTVATQAASVPPIVP